MRPFALPLSPPPPNPALEKADIIFGFADNNAGISADKITTKQSHSLKPQVLYKDIYSIFAEFTYILKPNV